MTSKTDNDPQSTDQRRTDSTDGTPGRDRETGLGLLLADVMVSDERERENLVRYADDPGALTEPERRALEARLEGDPGWRDRLAVLQHFDPRAADAQRLEGAGENVVSLSSRQPRGWGAWLGTAIAAGLLAVALFPLLSKRDDEAGRVARQDALKSDAAAWQTSERDPASAPSLRSPDREAQPVNVAREVEVTPQETPSILGVREVPRLEAVPDPDGSVVQLAHDRVVEQPGGPDAATTPIAGDVEGVVQGTAIDEVLLLAQLDAIEYRAPGDFRSRDVPRDIVRGAERRLSLVSWVPDHVAHSSTAQPPLYWELSGVLPEDREVGLVVTAEDASEPLFEGRLQVDPSRSRQRVDLASLDVALEAGVVYRWSVFVRSLREDPSADRIAQGWIEYRVPSDAFAARVARKARPARAAVYAEQGYWYDALALLVELDGEHPESPKAREHLAGFLARAGIDTTDD